MAFAPRLQCFSYFSGYLCLTGSEGSIPLLPEPDPEPSMDSDNGIVSPGGMGENRYSSPVISNLGHEQTARRIIIRTGQSVRINPSDSNYIQKSESITAWQLTVSSATPSPSMSTSTVWFSRKRSVTFRFPRVTNSSPSMGQLNIVGL